MTCFDDYARIFAAERQVAYQIVDALEAEYGYALDRELLERAARILACPLKAHPPNWQHGRVLYALTRAYLAASPPPAVNVLDIGTAKGFSALCLHWAIQASGVPGRVISVDVLEPWVSIRRNTVVECDGLKTLAETLSDFPEADDIQFLCSTGIDILKASSERIHVAFIDGKHSHEAVATEAKLLSRRQRPGDLAIFDDAQIDGVMAAIRSAGDAYVLRMFSVLPTRAYAIGTRRG